MKTLIVLIGIVIGLLLGAYIAKKGTKFTLIMVLFTFIFASAYTIALLWANGLLNIG